MGSHPVESREPETPARRGNSRHRRGRRNEPAQGTSPASLPGRVATASNSRLYNRGSYLLTTLTACRGGPSLKASPLSRGGISKPEGFEMCTVLIIWVVLMVLILRAFTVLDNNDGDEDGH